MRPLGENDCRCALVSEGFDQVRNRSRPGIEETVEIAAIRIVLDKQIVCHPFQIRIGESRGLPPFRGQPRLETINLIFFLVPFHIARQ